MTSTTDTIKTEALRLLEKTDNPAVLSRVHAALLADEAGQTPEEAAEERAWVEQQLPKWERETEASRRGEGGMSLAEVQSYFQRLRENL